jgi:hypothetical protein
MIRHDRSSFAFLSFVLLFAVAAGLAAWVRGSWLDEYWSWHLADPGLPPGKLLGERWIVDTHPPLANALYWLTRLAGADRLPEARLVLNLAALAFLTGLLLLFRRADPGSRSFYPVFGIAVLGLAGAATAFADFRSYFWQMAAAGGALAYLHYLLSAPAERSGRWLAVDAAGAAALLLSLWLHFVAALLMAPAAVLAAAALWWSGRGRAALKLALLLLVGLGAVAVAAAVQMNAAAGMLDVRWIGTGSGAALATFGARLGRIASAMAVPLLAMLVLARPSGLRIAPNGSTLFAVAVLGGLLAGAVLLLLANTVQPVVVERYLQPWSVMAAAALATILAPAVDRRPALLAALVAWSTLLLLRTAWVEGRRATWDEGAGQAAVAMARCPATRLYAAPHWRFGPFADSRSATLESPVAMKGYELVAKAAGVPVTVLDQRSPVLLEPGSICPILIWTSNLFAVPADAGPDELLRIGRIRLSRPASARMLFRDEQTLIIAVGPGR